MKKGGIAFLTVLCLFLTACGNKGYSQEEVDKMVSEALEKQSTESNKSANTDSNETTNIDSTESTESEGTTTKDSYEDNDMKVSFDSAKLYVNRENEEFIVVYYDLLNKTGSTQTAKDLCTIEVYQNGVSLDGVSLGIDYNRYDKTKILSNSNAVVAHAFKLKDDSDNITVVFRNKLKHEDVLQYEVDKSTLQYEEESFNNTESGEQKESANNDSNDEANTNSQVLDITAEELEAQLLEQPMFVVSTEYIIQDPDYKNLYPDMLNGVIKNNSGTDVKNATVAFAAYDENGFPVKIKGSSEFHDGSYVREIDYGDVNMKDGDTFGEGMGMKLDKTMDKIKYIKACVINYKTFDGNTWENPLYETWLNIYEDKPLELQE